MRCPACLSEKTKVVDSRDTNEGRETRRRRECEDCENRFTTFEKCQEANFMVIKRDHSRVPYNREKVERGIWTALKKRKVGDDKVSEIIRTLEEEWSRLGKEVPSEAIGAGIMRKLKDIDEVAYIRFASVYRDFQDLDSFEQELAELKD